jgi:hypothetical protein
MLLRHRKGLTLGVTKSRHDWSTTVHGGDASTWIYRFVSILNRSARQTETC